MRFLYRDPGLWPLALVPTLIFLVIAALGFTAGALWVTPQVITALGLGAPESWLGKIGYGVVAVVSWLASAVVGWFAAFALTPPLSSPALEKLVTEQETALGVPGRSPLGFFSELWCGLRAQVFAIAFATPLLLALWVLDWVFPPAAVLTWPLRVLVIALALAWNLFDYPLTLRGVQANDRIGFLLDHLPGVLGFGVAFAALFWIPCFGILMLPVGAVAATRLVWELLATSPEALPSLPRPRLPEIADRGTPSRIPRNGG